MPKPESAQENEMYKILWGFMVALFHNSVKAFALNVDDMFVKKTLLTFIHITYTFHVMLWGCMHFILMF